MMNLRVRPIFVIITISLLYLAAREAALMWVKTSITAPRSYVDLGSQGGFERRDAWLVSAATLNC